MPRANRYFLSGHIWHITHRCHNKEFLLKLVKSWQMSNEDDLYRLKESAAAYRADFGGEK